MSLVNGTTCTHMTAADFEPLFQNTILPLKRIFHFDAPNIQNLPEDFSEIQRRFMTNNLMSFYQFWELIEEYDLISDCGLIFFSYRDYLRRNDWLPVHRYFPLMYMMGGEKSRLRQLLIPMEKEQESDTLTLAAEWQETFSSRGNILLRFVLLYEIYISSLKPANEENIDFKFALILGFMSVSGSIFIMHGTILNLQALKIMHNTYAPKDEDDGSCCNGTRLKSIVNMMKLTFVGLLATFLPFFVLYFLHLTSFLFAVPFLFLPIKFEGVVIYRAVEEMINNFWDTSMQNINSLNAY